MGNWSPLPRKKIIEIGVYCAQQGQRIHDTAAILTRLNFRGVDAKRARTLLTRDIGRAFYAQAQDENETPLDRELLDEGWLKMFTNQDGTIFMRQRRSGQSRTIAAGRG